MRDEDVGLFQRGPLVSEVDHRYTVAARQAAPLVIGDREPPEGDYDVDVERRARLGDDRECREHLRAKVHPDVRAKRDVHPRSSVAI